MKLFLSFALLLAAAVSLRAADGTVFPTNVFIKSLVGTGDHVAADAGGRLMRTNITGSGTPGGSTYSQQINTNGTFFGDNFWQYFPASAAGGDGIARAMINDGTYTNMMRNIGFGTYSAHPLYLFAANTLRLALAPEGHFGPAAYTANSNAFSLGTWAYPWSTSFVNQVSTKVGMDVGVGSGTNGRAQFLDMGGTKFSQLEAPGTIDDTNTHRLWKGTNAGMVVALPTGVNGINQLTNVPVGTGQYVTYNGAAFVASDTLNVGNGTAAAPSIGWLSDADGSGSGLYRNAANSVGFAVNGTLRMSLQSSPALDLGATPIFFGPTVSGTTDGVLIRDNIGTMSWKNGLPYPVTNRLYRNFTNAAGSYVSGFNPTNASWLESGFDGVQNWAFLRSMADGSNQTTQPLVLGVGTNEAVKIHTNSTIGFRMPANFADGTAAVPSVGWLSDADGSGTGLFRAGSSSIGVSINGSEKVRFNNNGDLDLGQTLIKLGNAIATTDILVARDAVGTLAFKAVTPITNRIYRSYTNTVTNPLSGFNPTNAAWLESGFDGVHGWGFLRSMADGSNQTTQPLVLGVRTNGTLRLETNGAVTVPALGLATAIIAPSFTTGFGGHLWSDGTNLCVVLENSAGTRTTNKITMAAWP